jgi:hypothetical protein
MRHSTTKASVAWLAAVVVAGASVAGPGKAIAQDPDYSAFTATQFIPFSNYESGVLPFTSSVGLRFLIGDNLVYATMDTGTTGVMIPWYRVPGYRLQDTAQQHNPGWEFLSSSKLLWVGHWVPRDLLFFDSIGRPVATARVPVLAVEREVTCPGYDEDLDNGTCASADTTSRCNNIPERERAFCPYKFHPPGDKLAYIGVGFGREGDGQPGGLPFRNPLLNITRIRGEPVRPGSMRSGYIITPGGVHVGLTAENTARFAFAKLGPRMIPDSLHPGDSIPSTIGRDWGPATVCISVGGAPCATGTALIDAGIDQMYLTVPDSMPLDTVTVQNPSLNCAPFKGLADSSRVQVSFPGIGNPPLSYSFVVGDTGITTPSVVLIPLPGMTFVNTGRHFLREFNVLLDADSGYFGLRPIPRDPAWLPVPQRGCSTVTHPSAGSVTAPTGELRRDGSP